MGLNLQIQRKGAWRCRGRQRTPPNLAFAERPTGWNEDSEAPPPFSAGKSGQLNLKQANASTEANFKLTSRRLAEHNTEKQWGTSVVNGSTQLSIPEQEQQRKRQVLRMDTFGLVETGTTKAHTKDPRKVACKFLRPFWIVLAAAPPSRYQSDAHIRQG